MNDFNKIIRFTNYLEQEQENEKLKSDALYLVIELVRDQARQLNWIEKIVNEWFVELVKLESELCRANESQKEIIKSKIEVYQKFFDEMSTELKYTDREFIL